MPDWQPLLAVLVATALLVCLALRVATADLLALCCLSVLMLAQELSGTSRLPTPTESIAGFGSEGVITIALLFVVAAGLDFTGGTNLGTGWFFNRSKNLTGAQTRLLIPVAAFSGFLNNTPVVVALLPVVGDLAKRITASTSRLLLPLSFAAILGGMCTLIGTSTNLIVADLNQKAIEEGLDAAPLTFFSPAAVGIPATVIGLVYMIVSARWLIPERKPAVSIADDPRKYTVEVQVEPQGGLVGKTLEEAGLRHLPGLYVAEIQQEDGVIAAAKPNQRLRANDVLILVGALETVVDVRKIRGLAPSDDQARKLQIPAWRRTLVEAVVSPRCALLGKSIREGRFRSHYNAAVVAVGRGDKQLTGKLGDVRLEVGDVLLLEASPSFLHRHRQLADFFMVSAFRQGSVRRPERAWLAIVIMLAMVISAAAGMVSIMTAALVAAIAMVASRCCTMSEARQSIDWSILILIGAAMGIGSAMLQSGAADALAVGVIGLAGNNEYFSLALIFLVTMLCTELITNSATAVLMFPIALKTAAGLPGECSSTPFVIAVMIAASASFLTPFGYQTNLMVYGVGGYRPGDYLRFGLPLSVIVFLVTMFVVPNVWPIRAAP